MEFLTILIVFAVISKILEAIGGGGKKGPQRRPPRQRPQARTLPPGGTRPDAGNAADMLPDELWELLTGQKRPPREASPPVPTRTAPVLDDEVEEPRVVVDEEAEAAEYVRTHRRDVQGEISRTLDERRQAALQRLEQVTVPAGRVPPTEKVRHEEFHAKIDARPAPGPPASTVAAGLGLARPADLRRAFILSEVLGPPKALESESPDR